eukprot:scaffold246491_cov45-Prasinocladus_malaysianus.AAC.1
MSHNFSFRFHVDMNSQWLYTFSHGVHTLGKRQRARQPSSRMLSCRSSTAHTANLKHYGAAACRMKSMQNASDELGRCSCACMAVRPGMKFIANDSKRSRNGVLIGSSSVGYCLPYGINMYFAKLVSTVMHAIDSVGPRHL